jgi:D-alanyl-D-alanine carboxypeptidase
MRRFTLLSALLTLVMISSSCGGSESTNETSAPLEDQSQESETPETSEESPVAGEETPAPESSDEDPGGPLATAELERSIQAALDGWIAANGAPGSSLAVLLPDGSEVLVASGVQDLRADGATSTEDYWRIASISKPITSAVVLRLVEQGLVDVDATVATYLGDEWATGYELDGVDYAPLITIRQILDHTDGFREYAFDPGFYLMVSDRLDVSMDPQEVVNWAFGVGPQYVPGTEYSYNTVGHIVAGLVIEAVTGKTAHEAMRELVFDPAGVTELYLTPGESPPTYVPAMYVQGELADLISLLPGLAPYLDAAEVGDLFDLSVGPQEVLTSAPWTGGGIEAQMDDLARFFKAMFDGTVLQEETVELFSETALDTSYALGIQLSERVGYRTFEHGGGVPGFRSHARYFPDLDVSMALSTNLIPIDPDVGQLADTVTQLVLDGLEDAGWEVPSPLAGDQGEEAPEDPNAGTTDS